MTIEEIKEAIKDIPEGYKSLAMGHPINEDVNYHLQQLLLKWKFDSELFNEVLTALERKVQTLREYQKGRYKDSIFEHMNVEKWISPAREIK